jgi:formate hydrogenlyase transcriptional activator
MAARQPAIVAEINGFIMFIISVNCGAIATSLFFPSFLGTKITGATQRRLGRFEIASGGTIFLDEVGDLPPDIQTAPLRVLQERTIERVGGASNRSTS